MYLILALILDITINIGSGLIILLLHIIRLLFSIIKLVTGTPLNVILSLLLNPIPSIVIFCLSKITFVITFGVIWVFIL